MAWRRCCRPRILARQFRAAFQIVGIVADGRVTALEAESPLMVYMPYWFNNEGKSVLVAQSHRDAQVTATEIRRAVREVDPEIAIAKVAPLQHVIDEAVEARRYQTSVFTGFGVVALLIAVVGVYATSAYAVSRRRRELNIRVALGARVANVFALVLRQSVAPLAGGLAAGLAGTLAMGGVLASLLYEVRPGDPFVLGTVIGVIASVGILSAIAATLRGTGLRMLTSDPLNLDGAREAMKRTMRDGNRASDVTTRLRALFDKTEPASESVDPNEATPEVIALSLGEIQNSWVIVRTELADDLQCVTADRVQLQQVVLVRPAPVPAPVVRFETPAGRQAQVDFARFRFPWGVRYALLVVLGYSRLLWVRFYPRQDMRTLLGGLEEAFLFFGGVPRELLFDQMKAVIAAITAIYLWHNRMYEEDPSYRRAAVAKRQVSLRCHDRHRYGSSRSRGAGSPRRVRASAGAPRIRATRTRDSTAP